jgi:TolA-binding protein
MGNLNFQRLGNYKEAARCYDLLITAYPDWAGVKPAYHQLATCFQRLGDHDNEQRVYKSMMKVFPEDSQEYAYAKKQLGL